MRHEPQELVLDLVRKAELFGGRSQRGLRPGALGDVDQDVHGADERPVRVAQRRRIGHERDAAAVRAFGDRLVAARRAIFAERDSHWALVMGHWSTVGPEQPPRPAPFLAELRRSPPELYGCLIEERDPAVRVGRVHGHAERLEKVAIPLLIGLGDHVPFG